VSASGEDELVVLRDGFSARLAPYLLVIKLEAEGFRLVLDGDDHLDVLSGGALHPADVDALRRYRADVIRLLRYVPDDTHIREAAHA
jgi:hypothetical protein